MITVSETTNQRKLVAVKILHTVIWLFYNVVIFYLLYAVIVGKIDQWVWICLGLVAAEGMVLLIFKNFCPLTLIARRFSNSGKDNFDIYIPNWIAKHNKKIYTTIVIIAIAILVIRLLSS